MTTRHTPDDPVLTHNRAILLDALRATGAASSAIAYSGYGDSGNANEITILDASGNALDCNPAVTVMQESSHYTGSQWETSRIQIDVPLYDALGAFADRAVGLYHPGYENNEGCDGEITFDCAEGTVRMTHRDCYVEHIHTDTEL